MTPNTAEYRRFFVSPEIVGIVGADCNTTFKDIVQSRTISGTHELSKDMTSMAKLELNISFSYGVFGFGNSNRYQQDHNEPLLLYKGVQYNSAW